jgi:hypothetical protein
VLAGQEFFNCTIKKSSNHHRSCWRELLDFCFLIFLVNFIVYP